MVRGGLAIFRFLFTGHLPKTLHGAVTQDQCGGSYRYAPAL